MSELNKALINIKCELQKAKINKSGKNAHAGFTYFELADFLPNLNELMKKYLVNDLVSFTHDTASITLILGEESQTYSMPFVISETPLAKSGKKMMQDIQYLGALTTYYKRYLYQNAFGISDGEVIDSLDNEKIENKQLNSEKKRLCDALKNKGFDNAKIVSLVKFYDCGEDKDKIISVIDNLNDCVIKFNDNDLVTKDVTLGYDSSLRKDLV
jgi:hypothetical protein